MILRPSPEGVKKSYGCVTHDDSVDVRSLQPEKWLLRMANNESL